VGTGDRGGGKTGRTPKREFAYWTKSGAIMRSRVDWRRLPGDFVRDLVWDFGSGWCAIVLREPGNKLRIIVEQTQ
jgi:hypothetical protein